MQASKENRILDWLAENVPNIVNIPASLDRKELTGILQHHNADSQAFFVEHGDGPCWDSDLVFIWLGY